MHTTIYNCDVCKRRYNKKELIDFDPNKSVIHVTYKGYNFNSFSKDICQSCAKKIVEFFKKIEKDGI